MSQIAIDVVLFPSEEMMSEAIKLNKKIALPNQKEFQLNKENCIPHITLSMGCVDESNINIIENILLKISNKYSKINLFAENFRVQQLCNDKNFIGLELRENFIIKKLHQEIMNSLQQYLFYSSSKNMFINPNEINDITIKWVNSWKNKHNNIDSYNPHLSIGIGELIDYQFPIKFDIDKIAMCQLGNYCTCRKTLITVDLK